MKISVYNTPRKVILDYLNNNTNRKWAYWVDKEQNKFYMDLVRMFFAWRQRAVRNRSDRVSRELTSAAEYYFDENRISIIEHPDHPPRDPTEEIIAGYFYLFTKSTELMSFIDMKWLIKLLLEGTREEWIEWRDQKDLEFKILNIHEISKMYVKVNDIRTTNPENIIKMMLSACCKVSILKKIDENIYKFDPKWYEKELDREEEMIVEGYWEKRFKSIFLFPEYVWSPEPFQYRDTE